MVRSRTLSKFTLYFLLFDCRFVGFYFYCSHVFRLCLSPSLILSFTLSLSLSLILTLCVAWSIVAASFLLFLSLSLHGGQSVIYVRNCAGPGRQVGQQAAFVRAQLGLSVGGKGREGRA